MSPERNEAQQEKWTLLSPPRTDSSVSHSSVRSLPSSPKRNVLPEDHNNNKTEALSTAEMVGGVLLSGVKALNDKFWTVDRKVGDWLGLMPKIDKENRGEPLLPFATASLRKKDPVEEEDDEQQQPQLGKVASLGNAISTYLFPAQQSSKTQLVVLSYVPPKNGRGVRYEPYIPTSNKREEFWYKHPSVCYEYLRERLEEDGDDELEVCEAGRGKGWRGRVECLLEGLRKEQNGEVKLLLVAVVSSLFDGTKGKESDFWGFLKERVCKLLFRGREGGVTRYFAITQVAPTHRGYFQTKGRKEIDWYREEAFFSVRSKGRVDWLSWKVGNEEKWTVGIAGAELFLDLGRI